MKLRLDQDALTDDFFSDTRLLGIMAPVKNYQFCWQLNKLLGYSFRLNTDVGVQLIKKNRQYYFSLYHFTEPGGFVCHYLYHNQSNGEYLLPEFRHLDYLWLMKGQWVDEERCRETIQSLKSINCIQLVTELTNEKIKNKEHLVF